jgi:hypothetical protein
LPHVRLWVSGAWRLAPAHTKYHGYDILELPPPAQAWAANEILSILQTCVQRWVPGQTLASLGPRLTFTGHYAPGVITDVR